MTRCPRKVRCACDHGRLPGRARAINDAVAAAPLLAAARGAALAITHQTGERDLARVRDGYAQAGSAASSVLPRHGRAHAAGRHRRRARGRIDAGRAHRARPAVGARAAANRRGRPPAQERARAGGGRRVRGDRGSRARRTDGPGVVALASEAGAAPAWRRRRGRWASRTPRRGSPTASRRSQGAGDRHAGQDTSRALRRSGRHRDERHRGVAGQPRLRGVGLGPVAVADHRTAGADWA